MVTRLFLALIGAMAVLLGATWAPVEAPLVNVALTSAGTRVRADTEYGEHVGAPKAADGVIGHGSACWFSRDWTQLPCALTFELQQEEHLRRAVLYQGQWSGSMYHTKDFALEVSSDGRIWHRLAEGTLADDNSARCAVDLDVRTRWFRVVVLTSYLPFQTCGLAEVELYAERPLSVGKPVLLLNSASPIVSEDTGGYRFAFVKGGPQTLVETGSGALVADLKAGETAEVRLPFASRVASEVGLEAELLSGRGAEVVIAAGMEERSVRVLPSNTPERIAVSVTPSAGGSVHITVTADSDVVVRVSDVRFMSERLSVRAPILLDPTPYGAGPPPETPSLRSGLQDEMIRLDWEAQDGIGTARESRPYRAVLPVLVQQGNALYRLLAAERQPRADALARWRRAVARWEALKRSAPAEALDRNCYLRLHEAKRGLLLARAAPLLGPLVFVKQVPPCFSHQLTQYYGRYARPGGGVWVLQEPGRTMTTRELVGRQLPLGSYMHPEVSCDGRRVLFAYCPVDTSPQDTIQGHHGRYYHLYEVQSDGRRLRQLTDGAYNDFAPKYLPDGRIVFISTRRGGWHRCGTPGCENYVLTVAERDGSRPRPISFHETQEWDPAVLPDGRLVYTRWDYVDRNAVFFEHLWTTNPDGSRPAALFGNMTFNPVGIWEARPVPGSRKLIATAAAHHAMTAGSIILLDPSRGADGLLPIRRLTPDVPFPESETPVPPSWYAPMPGTSACDTEENRRWPNHCYRSPYPLGKGLFLVAYSFRGLVGEPRANPPNMFGIYLCDEAGNKELLYRDPNIASLWPIPLKARPKPPVVPTNLDVRLGDHGLMVLQNVYASLPQVPRGSIRALRIVQILPKSTPGKDLPPVGIPSGSPGKQVLGTVPVQPDGSAAFYVPARKELSFQALDEHGMAVQVMRSGTYAQPGEKTTCVGCHEARNGAPIPVRPMALRRLPSRVVPGPDGSRPLSYPILVQTVLDRKCLPCHSGNKPAGGVVLTGEPEGHYTRSYNALAPRVAYSDMGNTEALTAPKRFGAHASPLMTMLLHGHAGVELSPADIERLATWMDTGALFYGTFDPADQERQRRGERISGPKLE